jgi:hypothetical protein
VLRHGGHEEARTAAPSATCCRPNGVFLLEGRGQGNVQNMKVIGPDDNLEYVRRLATGLISQWNAIPASVQADILRDSTLAIDPTSPGQTGLEHNLKSFIRDRHAVLKGPPK